MFRNVRKKTNEISIEEAKELLKTSRRGVLALNGDDGYPYAIPVNYFYVEDHNQIIFHGSKAGHKADSLKRSDKICFTVYGNEKVKDLDWAPYLESTVVFGRCHMVSDLEETRRLCKQFAMKYYPSEAMVDEEIEISARAVGMYVIDIEHISGKRVQEK